jgi:L-sorbose 1-phosphate reductase
MSEKLEKYRNPNHELPKTQLSWELYGAGFDNLGKDGKPVELPLPVIAPDEMLARVDALGLCLSDIKVLKLGPEHPRLTGRDLATEPVVIGHEVTVTIVQVGEKLAKKFSSGQRFVVQADAFYQGKSVAFGYNLRGGGQQYTIINHILYAGDDGSYLLPIADTTGYSQAALSEPWACVERSYHIRARRAPKPRGVTWVIGLCGGDLGNYFLGAGFGSQSHPGPRQVVTTDLVVPVADDLRKYAFASGITVEESASLLQALPAFESNGRRTFDDIILIGAPRPGLVDRVSKLLNKGGHLALVAPEIVGLTEEIDIGRMHYDDLHICGTDSYQVMNAYRKGRHASTLATGGAMWIIGAGGPMGQMHLQRALEQQNGPRLVLASDLDENRLAFIQDRFSALAKEKGKILVVANAKELTPDFLNSLTANEGFTDIYTMVPVPALSEDAWKYLAKDGLLNIFAGVARGVKAKLALSPFCVRGARIAGSSGSALNDMRFTLAEAEAGRLTTDRAVAAVGGIYALSEGLSGVAEGRFPGKVVIYPQLDFPLLALPELAEHMPKVAAQLEDGKFWNREAEKTLLEELLK